MTSPKISALVVDDSAFMRRLVTDMLVKDPAIEVVGFARNGVDALAKITHLKPRVVTLDIEMPDMDGLTFLAKLMESHPVPVVMLSAHTTRGAEATIRALELGAVDFVTKPEQPVDIRDLQEELITKVKVAALISPQRLASRRGVGRTAIGPAPAHIGLKVRPYTRPAATQLNRDFSTIVIGASTGGPAALHTILAALPGDLPAALLMVQHMPSGFTASFAARLNELSALTVREASDGDKPAPGLALLAPGGWQMTLQRYRREARVVLRKESPVDTPFCPSVDVLMLSAAEVYGRLVTGVLLTGMGNDGTRGLQAILAAGGKSLAESRETCVVFGMPRAAVEAGAVQKSVPVFQVAGEIVNCVTATRMEGTGLIGRNQEE